jgi:hypothetical protein
VREESIVVNLYWLFIGTMGWCLFGLANLWYMLWKVGAPLTQRGRKEFFFSGPLGSILILLIIAGTIAQGPKESEENR